MKSRNPNVYIILLNYNGYKDTMDCINSLQSITYDNYNIVAVDNASTDNSEQILKKYINKFSNIKFIQTGKNLGFSGGNNVGIKFALDNQADYICLLNNDTIVDANFLSILVEQMEQKPEVGISAGKILYYDNPDTIWSAGGYMNELKSIGDHFGLDKLDNGEFDEIKEVTFLTGCLQLIRREVFENIGLYSEEYFLYMEDVDFCKRTSIRGYKLLYVPKSIIYHKVSASSGGNESPTVLYYLTRNRMIFNKKYQDNFVKSAKFSGYLIAKMLIDIPRKGSKHKYALRGYMDYFKGKKGYTKLK